MRAFVFVLIAAASAASWVSPARALPSREETAAFEASLAGERAAFEKETKTFAPGPAAKEIEKFRQQEIARKAALESNTAGMTLEQKKAAIAAYQAERRAAETAFRTKLDKLDASPVKLRNEQAAYRKNQLALKASFDEATASMPLDQKRAAIAAYADAVRRDRDAKTAELRKPVIAENLPDKRRAFEKKMIEKQRAFYASETE